MKKEKGRKKKKKEEMGNILPFHAFGAGTLERRAGAAL